MRSAQGENAKCRKSILRLRNWRIVRGKRGKGPLRKVLERTVSSMGGFHLGRALARRPDLLRKEVIQPLVPQRLPCYDFIPITTHTLGRRMPDFGCRRLS